MNRSKFLQQKYFILKYSLNKNIFLLFYIKIVRLG